MNLDIALSLLISWWQHLEGMVEFIGLLKVTLKKGTNLAVRDMRTSDSYVVLTLGQQVKPPTEYIVDSCLSHHCCSGCYGYLIC